MRLSKMILSSSVGVGGRVSIEIVIVISAVEAAIVVVGIGVVGLQGAAMLLVVSMFSVATGFGSSASSGRSVLLWRFERSLFL